MELFDARQALCEMGRRLWQRSMVAANDGNLSVRVGDDRLLATPTGVSKGFMAPGDMILTDLDGRVVQGDRLPSSELKMHLEVYRLRPDVQAVIHAHPPYATAFAVAGVPLDQCLLPESVVTMGAVLIAPYATPSTEQMASSISGYVTRADVVLLANHGALTWAGTLEAAYYRMETLEHTAAIAHHALGLGGPKALDRDQVAELMRLRERFGLTGPCLPCEAAEAPGGLDERELVERVTRAVLAALKRS